MFDFDAKKCNYSVIVELKINEFSVKNFFRELF